MGHIINTSKILNSSNVTNSINLKTGKLDCLSPRFMYCQDNHFNIMSVEKNWIQLSYLCESFQILNGFICKTTCPFYVTNETAN